MTDDQVDWTYSNMCEERIADLSVHESFESIADQISRKATNVEFSIDRGCRGLVKDCLRPEFRFRVDPDLGDLFFNGLTGYRAQYYHSTKVGEAANRHVIAALHDLLLNAAEMANFEFIRKGVLLTRRREEIDHSLGLPSAKIWPAEYDGNPEFDGLIDAMDDGTDPPLPVGIIADRWLDFERKGIKKAIVGVRAPKISWLEIKGAFVNRAGEERISDDKVLRSCEIHMLGFT